jgi:hypothetical protein
MVEASRVGVINGPNDPTLSNDSTRDSGQFTGFASRDDTQIGSFRGHSHVRKPTKRIQDASHER